MTRTALLCSGISTRRLARYFAALTIFLGFFNSAGAVDLFDDFERADNSNLGNGWIEKQGGAFTLQNGEAAKQSVATLYRDNVVYRPASEDLLDQEASIELNWLSGSIGYPQVFVRLQSATVAQGNSLDGYILYVRNSATEVILGKQLGGQFVITLATLNLSTALNTTDQFRLRLRATGTSPVQLSAWVERFDGSNWQVIGQANVSDSFSNRIATAGAVGFGGHYENTYSYDNFQRLDLDGGGGTPVNPVPVATSSTPDNAPAGTGALTITIDGSDFIASSVVRWNGSNRPTTFVSATQLNADISGADLATAGNVTITVFNSAPGGGESTPMTFTINDPIGNPVPQTTAITPNNATEGGSAFLLTVTGNSFIPQSVIRWNGADRVTTFISDIQLEATIPDTDIAAAGSVTVAVFTPAPGGGLSASQTFTIDSLVAGNPVPVVSGVTPANVTEGGGSFNLTVNGTNFVAGAVIRWDGSDRTTIFVSDTQLDAVIDATDISSAGSASITVFNPAPSGGLSNGATLTIDPSGPVQTINSVSPISASVGDSSAILTVNGSGFTALSDVQLDGIILPTTFVSATQLTATVDSVFLADNARAGLMVYTPEASNSLVGPIPFFVLDAGDTLFVDNFNRPDDANLGNQWTEKLPSAFSIANGVVTSIDTTPRAFNDTVTYRPPAQDGADIEVAVEFIRGTPQPRYPQVHARIQRDTVGLTSRLTSYTSFLYDNFGEFLTITPIIDAGECYLAQYPLIRPTVLGDRYRIRLRTLGTTTVRLTTYLDHFNVDRWETISAGSVIHDANNQPTPGWFCNLGYIPQPSLFSNGAVGFAKYIFATDDYDSFYSIRLANDNNAVPVAASLVPNSASVGGAAFPVTVNGDDFIPGTVVRWNGSDRPTTYISPTQLEAQISSADLASAGTADVTVFVPAPGGGESAPLVFTIGVGGVGLFDNFDRPDSTTLGNGWIENTPSTFIISNGQVAKQSSSSGYLQNLVYRPGSEDVQDVAVSMELRQVRPTAAGYPQIYARIQSSTVGYGWIDGYILYLRDSSTDFILGRQRGNSFVTALSTFTLTEPLTSVGVYRMSLQVTGSNPVQLLATVERQTTSGGWEIIGMASATDSSTQRLDNAGSVGFSGYIYGGYMYDNFLRNNLTQP